MKVEKTGFSSDYLPPTSHQMHACEILLRTKPTPDPETIARMVGDETASTLAEVSKAFGLAANTVKQSWRPTGMPGEPGNYRLAEILAWRIEHERTIRPKVAAAGDAVLLRLNALEKRIAALESRNNN